MPPHSSTLAWKIPWTVTVEFPPARSLQAPGVCLRAAPPGLHGGVGAGCPRVNRGERASLLRSSPPATAVSAGSGSFPSLRGFLLDLRLSSRRERGVCVCPRVSLTQASLETVGGRALFCDSKKKKGKCARNSDVKSRTSSVAPVYLCFSPPSQMAPSPPLQGSLKERASPFTPLQLTPVSPRFLSTLSPFGHTQSPCGRRSILFWPLTAVRRTLVGFIFSPPEASLLFNTLSI